jgi:hypothetical protein
MRGNTIRSALIAGFLAALFMGSGLLLLDSVIAKGASAKSSSRGGGPQFLIESPHAPAECLAVLREVSAGEGESLAQWHFGCRFGEHVGWALVSAPSEKVALAMVPRELRSRARVHRIGPFTADQIASLHDRR